MREESLSIYPNPAQGELNITFQAEHHQSVIYRITDILGRQCIADIPSIINPGANQETISIQTLSPGVYFLNLVTGEGSLQRRFIRK